LTSRGNVIPNRLRRVVITGIGIVSCIGNDPDRVTARLRNSESGIRHIEEFAELGLNSQVAGIPDLADEPQIDRKTRRFMADGAIYAHHAMRKAIDDASLSTAEISHPRTGLIIGSGVGSLYQHHRTIETFLSRGISKVPPYCVPQIMGSTASACLAIAYGVKGPSYSITSACASSAHCIGNGADLIRHGVVDRVFVGGAEEGCWTSAVPFDAMGALSTRYNATPKNASRPFDCDRDGFVIAGGSGILVLEAEETARNRGARIYAEVAGYGACSDGKDMVQPEARGASRSMFMALENAENPVVDYINPHATSTPLGDIAELDAIRQLFGNNAPAVSSTKGLTGHAIAASGVHEAIFCLLMIKHGFIAASANLFNPDPAAEGIPIVRKTVERKINVALSNSIGFGGTNVSLVFRRLT